MKNVKNLKIEKIIAFNKALTRAIPCYKKKSSVQKKYARKKVHFKKSFKFSLQKYNHFLR